MKMFFKILKICLLILLAAGAIFVVGYADLIHFNQVCTAVNISMGGQSGCADAAGSPLHCHPSSRRHC